MLKTIQLTHTLYYLIGILFSLTLFANPSLEESQALRTAITVENIRNHQKALQDIAKQNAGNRMAGTTGYTASVAYVRSKLESAGFTVRLQEFPIALSKDSSGPDLKVFLPEERDFVAGKDFVSIIKNGDAKITAEIEAVDLIIPSPSANSSTSGCNKEDFKNFKPGNIALIQRGSCSFKDKIEHAISAKASGVIIFNEGNAERTEVISSRLEPSIPNFPVVGMSFDAANELRNKKANGPTGVRASLTLNVIQDLRFVQNLITEIDGKNNNRVVVTGAHLDGVRGGPGINDNGSGSSAILELALKYKELKTPPENKLRFIWFAAEEFGLLGSDYYVSSLTPAENQKIIAMLNFDMIGSSNYARFVYDGDNSHKTKVLALPGPAGSAYIETIFLNYFSGLNLFTHPTAFDGRSDYGPFIEAGIPAGGLFSGAEGIKSRHFAEIYGGTSGISFDPCYHRSCDDFAHTGGDLSSALALKSLDELSDAAAHALFHLSRTKDLIRSEQTLPEKLDFEYRGNFLQR